MAKKFFVFEGTRNSSGYCVGIFSEFNEASAVQFAEEEALILRWANWGEGRLPHFNETLAYTPSTKYKRNDKLKIRLDVDVLNIQGSWVDGEYIHQYEGMTQNGVRVCFSDDQVITKIHDKSKTRDVLDDAFAEL